MGWARAQRWCTAGSLLGGPRIEDDGVVRLPYGLEVVMQLEAPPHPVLPADPLPEGSRILHIGPSKTGTTALQWAFWSVKAELARQGLDYAGDRRHTSLPSRAVTGTRAFDNDDKSPPSMRWWAWMMAELRKSKATRVLYSSEFLAHANDEQAARIVRDVGPSTEIVLTLRPLDAILASKWQQAVQAGSTRTLEEWLERHFGDRSLDHRSSPWRMHNHGLLVDRWASVAGADRVSVIVANPQDHGFLYRAFEGLCGLRPDTLQPVDGAQNRSLTYPEVELIRQLNLQVQEAGIRRTTRNYLVFTGAAQHAKRRPPDPEAPRVRLPSWAAAEARDLAEESIAAIRASGVRIIGDLDLLMPRLPDRDDEQQPDLRTDPSTSAAIALGMAYGTGLKLGSNQPSSGMRELPFVPTRNLIAIILRRARLGLRLAWRLRRQVLD
jgi:hypothetical protein